jgi:hypothetical protein
MIVFQGHQWCGKNDDTVCSLVTFIKYRKINRSDYEHNED